MDYTIRSKSSSCGIYGNDLDNTDDLDDSIKCENTYAKLILHALNDLRLSGKFCDIVIKVEDAEFPCHKCVLVASSPYFATMFQDHFIESQQNCVLMHYVDSQSMKCALQFIYTGKTDFTEENARDLAHIGEFLAIAALRNKACEFLETAINADNCLGLYHMAQNFGYSNLEKAAHHYIERHFEDIGRSQEFLDLTREQLVAIISQDSLLVKHEETVFEAVLRWCNGQQNRLFNLHEVMKHVRLFLLEPEYLRDCTVRFPQLKALPNVMEIIDRANSVFSLPICILHDSLVKPRVNSKISVIIVAGGWKVEHGPHERPDLNTVKCYQPFTRQWFNLPSLQNATKEFAIVPLRNGFFVSEGNYRMSRSLRNSWIFNADSAEWRNSGFLCEQLSDAGFVEINGRIYIVGGMTLESVEYNINCFDPSNLEQFVAGRLTMPVYRSAVVTHNGMIYSAGGLGLIDSVCRSLQRFDLANGRCILLSPMLTDRSGAGACILNDFIYVIGGKNGKSYLNSVERYYISENRWEFISPMEQPRHRPGVAVVHGNIFALGGETEFSTYTYTVERYDPFANRWETVSTLPLPVTAFACTAFKIKYSAFVSEEQSKRVKRRVPMESNIY